MQVWTFEILWHAVKISSMCLCLQEISKAHLLCHTTN